MIAVCLNVSISRSILGCFIDRFYLFGNSNTASRDIQFLQNKCNVFYFSVLNESFCSIRNLYFHEIKIVTFLLNSSDISDFSFQEKIILKINGHPLLVMGLPDGFLSVKIHPRVGVLIVLDSRSQFLYAHGIRKSPKKLLS